VLDEGHDSSYFFLALNELTDRSAVVDGTDTVRIVLGQHCGKARAPNRGYGPGGAVES